MICQVDNKTTFQQEEPYTVMCEACSLFCKVYKYRSCEDRFKWCNENNIDIFEEYRQIDKLAASQMGVSGNAPPPPSKVIDSTIPKKPSRRGR